MEHDNFYVAAASVGVVLLVGITLFTNTITKEMVAALEKAKRSIAIRGRVEWEEGEKLNLLIGAILILSFIFIGIGLPLAVLGGIWPDLIGWRIFLIVFLLFEAGYVPVSTLELAGNKDGTAPETDLSLGSESRVEPKHTE